MNYIYAFKAGKKYIYIGNTEKPTYRIWAHYGASRGDCSVRNYLRKHFIKKGIVAEFVLLDAVHKEYSCLVEKTYIKAFSSMYPLINKVYNNGKRIVCEESIIINSTDERKLELQILSQINKIKIEINQLCKK